MLCGIPCLFESHTYLISFSGGNKPWYVFYHFVGAVPGSTALRKALQRLLLETDIVDVSHFTNIDFYHIHDVMKNTIK